MKNIFCYVLSLGMLILVSCNDDNKGKKDDKDSTDIVGKKDAEFDQMRSFFATPLLKFDPDSTRDNLGKYPDLKDKTEYVKFDYEGFLMFIDSLDMVFKTPAKEIYMVYGAYTRVDAERYLLTHRTQPPLQLKDILNQPTLLVGYKDPTNGQMFYKDFATICPPPASCQSFFMYPDKRTFFGNTQAGFNPDSTINNYRKLYDRAVDPVQQLTQYVKFDIAGIKYLVDSLNSVNHIKADHIYFSMGAYTGEDAGRYIKTHPGTTKNEIDNRTCLLFAYKDPKVTGFTYLDFGTICPPPASCQTSFYYGK
jgi:hypothetical protein